MTQRRYIYVIIKPHQRNNTNNNNVMNEFFSHDIITSLLSESYLLGDINTNFPLSVVRWSASSCHEIMLGIYGIYSMEFRTFDATVDRSLVLAVTYLHDLDHLLPKGPQERTQTLLEGTLNVVRPYCSEYEFPYLDVHDGAKQFFVDVGCGDVDDAIW